MFAEVINKSRSNTKSQFCIPIFVWIVFVTYLDGTLTGWTKSTWLSGDTACWLLAGGCCCLTGAPPPPPIGAVEQQTSNLPSFPLIHC